MAKRYSILITFIILLTALFCSTAYAEPAIQLTSVSANTVNFGGYVTIKGKLTDINESGKITLLVKKPNKKTYSYHSETSTDSENFSFRFKPQTTASYRVRWNYEDDGVNPTPDPLTSSNYLKVRVRPKVSLYKSPRTIYVGTKSKFYGRINPKLRGRVLSLQRNVRGRWITIGRTRTNKWGGYKFLYSPKRPGTYTLRVYYNGEAVYYKNTSRKIRFGVKWRNPFGISAGYKHYIVVQKSRYYLYYISYGYVKKRWNCAVGMPSYPTPSGTFSITLKRYRPTWYNPGSSWSSNMPSSIAWPNSPLGERALNLSASGIRIHGTTQPWLLDQSYRALSHGCIRLKNENVIWLYNTVPVGTRVKIL